MLLTTISVCVYVIVTGQVDMVVRKAASLCMEYIRSR